MDMPFDIKRVQDRLFAMAKTIATILEKSDIPYEIAFGTLLGAVRHGGFIPWDDDFDFFLFDDTYEKAMDVLAKELPADMFLENEKTEPNFFHAWSRVKDTGTECTYEHYPQDEIYSHHGLCVDLFRIKKINARDFAQFRYEHAVAYIDRRKKLGLISPEEYEKRKASFDARKPTEVIDEDREILAYPFDIGKQYPEDVFPLKRYKIGDYDFWGPINPDRILTMRYGKYMELPPVEARIPHFGSVTFIEKE